MKLRKSQLTLLVSILMAAVIPGCSTTTTQEGIDAKANAVKQQQAADKALADSAIASQQLVWHKFRADAELTISAYDSTINNLKNKIAGTDRDRRVIYIKKLDSLELKNQGLKLALAKYPDTTMNTWAQFKRDFDRDMNELGAALKDFKVSNE